MKRPFPDHEAADAERRQQVGLFRYGVIADVIHLERGQRGLYAKLREKAAREWDIPGSRRRKVEVETLRGWLAGAGALTLWCPKPAAIAERPAPSRRRSPIGCAK